MDWDTYFMALAKVAASRSKDPSTKCGAVIADSRNRLVSTGYNGFPQGIADTPARLNERAVKYQKVIHAEVNAILFAARDLAGCTLYVWPMPPCEKCAPIIIQAGIKRVVSVAPNEDQSERWGAGMRIALADFTEAGVDITYSLEMLSW